MQSTKTNYEMKQYNFQTVFKIIQRYSSISRRELQNLSSLSWGSISSITADMVSNGLIIEKSHKLGYSGRTPKLLTINNQKNRILGIDINVSAITFALCDLGGLVLQSERVRPQELHKSYILSLIDEYIAKYFATYDEIIMIAFSVQGQIDRTENISVSIDKIDGWETVPLRSLFAEKYGRPVYIFHDPDCLLIYTLAKMRNFTDVNNCVALRLSADGIGFSALIDGNIYKGAGDTGIEIEHTTLVPNGQKCKCGRSGCFYAYCTLEGLSRQYKSGTYDEFLSLVRASETDETSLRIFKNYAYYLAVAVQNLIMLFNPEYLFLNGEMTEYKKLFEKEFYLKLNNNYHSRVFFNSFDTEHPAVGAALLAVSRNLNELLFHD